MVSYQGIGEEGTVTYLPYRCHAIEELEVVSIFFKDALLVDASYDDMKDIAGAQLSGIPGHEGNDTVWLKLLQDINRNVPNMS